MTTWRYIKGSEKDFEGAPEWATHRVFNSQSGTLTNDNQAFANGVTSGSKWVCTIDKGIDSKIRNPDEWYTIAQRDRVTSINDDRLALDLRHVRQTLEPGADDNLIGERCNWVGDVMIPDKDGEWVKTSKYVYDKVVTAPPADNVNPKYNRPCKGVTIDVYDVLHAFNVTNPALQHLVKKALAVGQRGHKDKMEDLRDILASAQRAIELEEMSK